MQMTKSWAVVIVPVILFLIGQGFVLVTGVELTDSQQTALSEILNLIFITATVGGSVGVARIVSETIKAIKTKP